MGNNLKDFEKELTILINRYSLEKHVNMPDYAIAEYFMKNFTSLQDAIYMHDTKGVIPDIDFKN